MDKLKDLWSWFSAKKSNVALFTAGAAFGSAVDLLLTWHPSLAALCAAACVYCVWGAQKASADDAADEGEE